MAKRTQTKRNSSKSPSLIKTIVSILKDERFKIILGMLCLFFSIFLSFAFVSYMFTWKHDQDIVDKGWEVMILNPDKVENHASKLGAYLANTFMHDWFGVPSFVVVFLLFIIGLRLMNIKTINIGKAIKYSIIGVIWTSISLGFFFGKKYFYLGGAHGLIVSDFLCSMIGNIGTFFLILISLFAIVIFTFDNSIEFLKKFFIKAKNTTLSVRQPIDKIIPKKINKILHKKNKPTEKRKIIVDSDEKDTTFGTEEKFAKDQQEVEDATDKKEFILNDKGEEIPLDLEIERSTKEEELVVPNLGLETIKTPENQEKESSDTEMTEEQKMAMIVEKNKDIQLNEAIGKIEDYDPKLDLSRYVLPPIDLLENHKSGDIEVSNEELLSNKNKIVETLKNYKIDIKKIKATVGPTITLYEIIPAAGVRISKIKNLEDDIALSLSALGIRIIAPMPGRGTVGIEVPNQKPKIVSMRSVISSKKFQESKYELPIAIGKTISNETYVGDLAKMPHLLVAGATGQGKSVGLNAILTSLLYKKHPAQVKFVLIDPKKVELTLYEKIERHFLAKLPDSEEAIITDNQKVIHTLASLNTEMDARYGLLKNAMVRNIKEYNAKFISRRLNPEKGHRYLPYIVVVIDEFADLIMTAGKEVEMPIARLAQLARAIGIHLIVATQRPSTNIITGVIKANFPSRIAFKVAAMQDSRTILDSPGANQLIGRGDMLITQGSDLIRLQCAFIDTPEIDKITDFIGSQQGYSSAMLLPEYESGEGENASDVDLEKRDELFEEAARLVVAHQQGSTSLIQRKMSIGYNRAGRIIDQLEAAGVVGPFEGSKARAVLYHDEMSLEQYLNSLN
ncbi:MAG: cell division protein FtsK [Bacteroidia bacterium]|nr:MAG: cell division protein FtsK [Bacteroidia bacterium]PIE86518.1 MAG: cell division protein FtsK [Bacteroidia bacterium]